MPKAGNFEITVYDPYPCWVDINYKGKLTFTIPHSELSDLLYVLEKAMKEAWLKLKDKADEV